MLLRHIEHIVRQFGIDFKSVDLRRRLCKFFSIKLHGVRRGQRDAIDRGKRGECSHAVTDFHCRISAAERDLKQLAGCLVDCPSRRGSVEPHFDKLDVSVSKFAFAVSDDDKPRAIGLRRLVDVRLENHDRPASHCAAERMCPAGCDSFLAFG